MLQSFTSKVVLAVGVATVAVSTVATPEAAEAAGLRFNSQLSPNEYQYQVFASFAEENSVPGTSFTLTGLSGVTGVSVSGIFSSFLNSSFTDSSATFTWNGSAAGGSFSAADVNGTPLNQFDFRILSTSSTLGSVLSQGPNGFSDITQGPVAAIPTPALLPGLVGMGIAALRKRKGETA